MERFYVHCRLDALRTALVPLKLTLPNGQMLPGVKMELIRLRKATEAQDLAWFDRIATEIELAAESVAAAPFESKKHDH